MIRSVPHLGKAVTLVETVVVCAVVGVLSLLGCAAIQGARESSRRLQCGDNLRQLGTALSRNDATFGNFGSPMPSRGSRPGASYFEISGLYELLPALEQNALYNAINIIAKHGVYDRANASAVQVRISVFLCPSDSVAWGVRSTSPLDYRFNVGSPRPGSRQPGTDPSGSFTPLRASYAAQFGDGLSTTAGVSERIIGRQSDRIFDPFRDYWFAEAAGFVSSGDSDEVAAICSTLQGGEPLFFGFLGRSWLVNNFHGTWYNHVFAPNSRRSDCSADSLPVTPGDTGYSAVTSRSMHGATTHTLFMDGSVRAVKSSIDLRTWRSLGTRSGGEVVGTDN
jgi:hypothetical protein